ncbi:MAG: multicopper oxidase family protein [Fimbriimonadales bacterium]|nr:multicopper oxidase family protein [Fimbriimonadales bacterium]
MSREISRRRFLSQSAAAAAAVALGSKSFAQGRNLPPAEILLTAAPGSAQILPGDPTPINRFTAKETTPARGIVGRPGDSFLGPTIRVQKGQRLRVLFVNNLDNKSIVHWHGLDVPEASDGHPRFAVDPGETFWYDFTVINRAGTYWYHPHPDQITGPQVYSGLAGLLVVSDDEEASLPLPQNRADIPCVIQDRVFNTDNSLVYETGGREGFLGDVVLVNGKPSPNYYVGTRCYRLRFLNGSNSRIYKLAWSDGTPMDVIATDGGLLEAPVSKPYVMLAPGQRVEVWADFRNRQVGEVVTLKSLEFSGAGLFGGALPQGHPFDLMTFSINRQEFDNLSLPKKLAPFERYDPTKAVNYKNPRVFDIVPNAGMWLFNNLPFEMENVSENEIVRRGDLEIWEFKNTWPGMKMAHPIHLHGPNFQVVERTIDPAYQSSYNNVKDGYVDEGIVDTVMLMPGETIKIAIRWDNFAGLFLYHCHNLEHEDRMMMRNFRILP